MIMTTSSMMTAASVEATSSSAVDTDSDITMEIRAKGIAEMKKIFAMKYDGENNRDDNGKQSKNTQPSSSPAIAPVAVPSSREWNQQTFLFNVFVVTTIVSVLMDVFFGGLLLPESHHHHHPQSNVRHDDYDTVIASTHSSPVPGGSTPLPPPSTTSITSKLTSMFDLSMIHNVYIPNIVAIEAFTPPKYPQRRNRHSSSSPIMTNNHQQSRSPKMASTTALFLEDWVAKMIDDELYRQSHRKEFEDEWMKKNRRAVLSRISSEGFDDVVFGDDNDNPALDEEKQTTIAAKATNPVNTSTSSRSSVRDIIRKYLPVDPDKKKQQRQDEKKKEKEQEMDYATLGVQSRREDFRQHAKDVKLAEASPERYCADRCVATGHCDVYEDMYDMTPQQVIEFCTECVLSDDVEKECDIPASFFNDEGDDGENDDRTGTDSSGLRP